MDNERAFNEIIRILEPVCENAQYTAESNKVHISQDELPYLLSLFKNVMALPTPAQLERIDEVYDALIKEFSAETTFDEAHDCFLKVSKVEAVLKHILCLVKPELEYTLLSTKRMLAWCLTRLGLIPPQGPDSIDFNTVTPMDVYLNPRTDYPYLEYILEAYNCRNTESHECPKWTRYQLCKNEVCVLMTYLYTCRLYQTELEGCLENSRLSGISCVSYCEDKIIENQNKNINDNFKYYPFRWRMENDTSLMDIEDTLHSSDKYVLLYGEAGSGKSVALTHVFICACQEYVENPRQPIPVFVEMKYLNGETITEYVERELGLSKENCEYLFKTGHIYLFLDGINEIVSRDAFISTREKHKCYIEEIIKLFNSYPIVKMWMSDRAITNFGTEKITLKSLQIQTMTREDVQAFCNELISGEGRNVSVSLTEEVLSFLNTPFKIKMYAEIIKNDDVAVETISELTDKYLQAIVMREWKEKGTLDISSADIFMQLLIKLSANMSMTEIGAGLSFSKTFELVSTELEKYGESRSKTQACLDIAVELKILEQNDLNFYDFASGLYAAYFYSRYILDTPSIVYTPEFEEEIKNPSENTIYCLKFILEGLRKIKNEVMAREVFMHIASTNCYTAARCTEDKDYFEYITSRLDSLDSSPANKVLSLYYMKEYDTAGEYIKEHFSKKSDQYIYNFYDEILNIGFNTVEDQVYFLCHCFEGLYFYDTLCRLARGYNWHCPVDFDASYSSSFCGMIRKLFALNEYKVLLDLFYILGDNDTQAREIIMNAMGADSDSDIRTKIRLKWEMQLRDLDKDMIMFQLAMMPQFGMRVLNDILKGIRSKTTSWLMYVACMSMVSSRQNYSGLPKLETSSVRSNINDLFDEADFSYFTYLDAFMEDVIKSGPEKFYELMSFTKISGFNWYASTFDKDNESVRAFRERYSKEINSRKMTYKSLKHMYTGFLYEWTNETPEKIVFCYRNTILKRLFDYSEFTELRHWDEETREFLREHIREDVIPVEIEECEEEETLYTEEFLLTYGEMSETAFVYVLEDTEYIAYKLPAGEYDVSRQSDSHKDAYTIYEYGEDGKVTEDDELVAYNSKPEMSITLRSGQYISLNPDSSFLFKKKA